MTRPGIPLLGLESLREDNRASFDVLLIRLLDEQGSDLGSDHWPRRAGPTRNDSDQLSLPDG
jgi:hypothetical protein